MLRTCLEALNELSETVLPLSPSGIRGFVMGCPIQRIVGKILKTKLPPRVFLGSAVDAGVTHWLSGGDETLIKQAVYKTIDEIGNFELLPAQASAICEEAYALVLHIIDSSQLPKSVEKVQAWVRLNAGPKPWHAMRGKIDFLEKGPGGYVVWDLKVTTKPTVKSVSKYRNHLMIYAAALIEEGYDVKTIALWQVNPKDKKITLATEQIHENDVERIKITCSSISDVYKNGVLWIPPKFGDVCNSYDCDHFARCPFGFGKAKEFLVELEQYKKERKDKLSVEV